MLHGGGEYKCSATLPGQAVYSLYALVSHLQHGSGNGAFLIEVIGRLNVYSYREYLAQSLELSRGYCMCFSDIILDTR